MRTVDSDQCAVLNAKALARQAQRELNAAREFVEAFSRTPMLAVGVALMTRRQFSLTAGRAKKLIAEQLMRDGVISAADVGKKL